MRSLWRIQRSTSVPLPARTRFSIKCASPARDFLENFMKNLPPRTSAHPSRNEECKKTNKYHRSYNCRACRRENKRNRCSVTRCNQESHGRESRAQANSTALTEAALAAGSMIAFRIRHVRSAVYIRNSSLFATQLISLRVPYTHT